MNVNDLFASAYIKASDLDGGARTLTVQELKAEELGRGPSKETKAVLYFEEADKGLILNVTNKNTIQDGYGQESDNWIGKPVELFSTKVEYKGDRVDGIRVRIPAPASAEELLDDSVPF